MGGPDLPPPEPTPPPAPVSSDLSLAELARARRMARRRRGADTLRIDPATGMGSNGLGITGVNPIP